MSEININLLAENQDLSKFEIAENFSDKIIITDDNPRDENPKKEKSTSPQKLFKFLNEEMKQTINSFQEGLSKEKRIDFQEQIRICIERNDLWVERKTSNPEVMAELYDNNVGLAQCLRDKGVEVADPTQENPKINLESTGMSREELKEKLEECSEEGWSLGRGKK